MEQRGEKKLSSLANDLLKFIFIFEQTGNKKWFSGSDGYKWFAREFELRPQVSLLRVKICYQAPMMANKLLGY